MEKHFDGVFCVSPGLLYQGGWSREWSAAAEAYGIMSFIDVAGIIPRIPSFPHRYNFFASFPFEDNDTLPNFSLAHACASLGASLVKSGEPLLVCCLEGINRSAFMCGLILYHLGLGDGATIMSRLRDANPDCLDKRTLRDFIEKLPKK